MSAQIGIQGSEFKTKPIGTIYRFKVYCRGKFELLSFQDQVNNLNYQINGQKNEQVVVRLWKREEGIYKGRYYASAAMDAELAELLAKEWVKRLRSQLKFTKDFDLKLIEAW